MKLVLLGTSEFALRCADAILESGDEICALISMPACALPNNSADVSQFAQAHNIPYHEIEDVNDSHSVAMIRGFAGTFWKFHVYIASVPIRQICPITVDAIHFIG